MYNSTNITLILIFYNHFIKTSFIIVDLSFGLRPDEESQAGELFGIVFLTPS